MANNAGPLSLIMINPLLIAAIRGLTSLKSKGFATGAGFTADGSARQRRISVDSMWKSKCHDRIRSFPRLSITACRDDDILPAVAATIGHRRCLPTAGQLRLPELLSSVDVERSNEWIDGRGHEHEPAGSRDRSSEVGRERGLPCFHS